MASKMQSCEMLFQDSVSMAKKSEKSMISTKWNLIASLIAVTILIFGILLTPIYIYSSQMNEKFQSLNKDFKKITNGIEELKRNEEIIMEKKMDTNKNSFEHYVRVGEFGYFQKLENKMSFRNGQVACNKIHGKIIESDERYGNATSKYILVDFF